MIWYRHWIEMRGGLCVAAGCVVIICLLYPLSVHGSADWFDQSGRFSNELKPFGARMGKMDSPLFLSWGIHAWFSSAAAVIVGIFLGGTGIRTSGFQPGHRSMYYTLMLPVSRFGLIWTRFASACAAVYALLATMLAIDCATLLIMGRTVPLGPMAVSSFLAGLLVVAVLAVFGLLLPLWNEQVSALVFVAAIGAAMKWAWVPITGFTGSQDIPWLTIGAIFLVTGAALSAAAMLARNQDF